MKTRVVIQIAVVVSVLLLCTGIGIYSFLRLERAEQRHGFNLYTLVPQDAVAVVETDRMSALVDDINALVCSRDGRFLYVSDLFVYLKNYLHTLVDDTPHGLSNQMNNMLISFHSPDTPDNQVLYCNLGEGDYELAATFLAKYSSSHFPPKEFTYRGKSLCIYSLADGRFLTTYFTKEYLVISFQKRLVEAVIDARLDKRSLMRLPSFRTARGKRTRHLASTVYLRQPQWGTWMEFDLKFNDTVIYCSGIAHQPDTTHTLVTSLRRQPTIEGFSGACLPASTIAYTRCALSDSLSNLQNDTVLGMLRNPHWSRFLREYAEGSITVALFLSADTLSITPCTLFRIPLTRPAEAAERLWELPAPANDFVTRIHRGALLMAPHLSTLNEYIRTVDRGESLESIPFYEQGIAALVPTYQYLLSVDMARLLDYPNLSSAWLPPFFLHHAKFFRHFLLDIQVVYADNELQPNLVLRYRD